ncbi:MAG TPA: signal peptidase I [Longimicrobium sp.]|nr:signal peptidase I [Longimicrobium sp.]
MATSDIKKPAAAAGRRDAQAAPKSEAVEWVKSIAIAVALFLVIRTFLITAYSIPSNSMENTLLIGDFLMANNAVFGAEVPFTGVRLPAFRDPKHGEIVVFRPTYNDPIQDVVKRVIGLPGDTLWSKDGAVFRNGKKLDEPYAQFLGVPDDPVTLQNPESLQLHKAALAPGVDPRAYTATRNNWGPLVVPAGHYFMMGDNRDMSLDSRFMGFIPREVIRGKPLFIYFSYDRERDAPFPRFLTAARWGRIGTGIRTCCD